MEEYTNLLKQELKGKRNCRKNVFKLAGRIYRGRK